MAYYDENGRITIDEVVAEKDINTINHSNELLLEAKQLFEQMVQLASEFKGNTGTEMVQDCNDINNLISNLINANNENINAIRDVLRKYETIDINLKNDINNLL